MPAATPPGAAERFLSAGPGALWRATAGRCGETEPLLERSTDDGATWQDVTPRYLGIGQILSLDAFADTEAQMVALMGPGCELQALRTFTQGRFWEPYPDVLAASTYVDPADPATVVIAGAAASAPCPEPWGVRAASGTVGLICDGTAYERVDGTWMPVAEGALAITADGAGVTAAAIRADCTGVWIASPARAPAFRPRSPIRRSRSRMGCCGRRRAIWCERDRNPSRTFIQENLSHVDRSGARRAARCCSDSPGDGPCSDSPRCGYRADDRSAGAQSGAQRLPGSAAPSARTDPQRLAATVSATTVDHGLPRAGVGGLRRPDRVVRHG